MQQMNTPIKPLHLLFHIRYLQTLVLTLNLHCNATCRTLRFIPHRFNGWDLLAFIALWVAARHSATALLIMPLWRLGIWNVILTKMTYKERDQANMDAISQRPLDEYLAWLMFSRRTKRTSSLIRQYITISSPMSPRKAFYGDG
jgi:hypothetical protein